LITYKLVPNLSIEGSLYGTRSVESDIFDRNFNIKFMKIHRRESGGDYKMSEKKKKYKLPQKVCQTKVKKTYE
jgi:hypothetical protein